VLFVDQNDEQALRRRWRKNRSWCWWKVQATHCCAWWILRKSVSWRVMLAVSVVDNTFLSPALQNPLALGADLVLHSCTKYLNGHSDVVAGVVIAKDPETVTELAWWANNIGVTGGAFDSYLLLRGLRTLSPRMEVAQRNAQAIVDF
jgi:cystathionine gamma-synthase